MKANNLTICIDAPCNKSCPYCISNMTFYPKPDKDVFKRNIEKAHKLAELASVISVLLSSKGEPLLNSGLVQFCCHVFHDFPLELQTNGVLLLKDYELLGKLRVMGINTIAFSVDSFKAINDLSKAFKECKAYGINIRITVVLTDLWTVTDGYNFLADCNLLGIKEITFRLATIPENNLMDAKSMETAHWIKKHGWKDSESHFKDHLASYEREDNLIRVLPFGPKVYDMEGIAVTTIPYCIQESNNTEDIRSLIYHQDGHCYTSWDKQSSILF